ncbi:MAG: hypothetical protein DCF32_15055 [Leptolyngbya sp.]|nr:MAG: hypothetical protein DCF32_15055 [Leptolyngbya sp.]
MAVCHPDRVHYANGQCEQCYRKEHFSTDYVRSNFGDKLPLYRAAYEKSEKGLARNRRHQRVRRGLSKVLGKKEVKLREVFVDPSAISRLRDALESGDITLLGIWSDLRADQQKKISGKEQD